MKGDGREERERRWSEVMLLRKILPPANQRPVEMNDLSPEPANTSNLTKALLPLPPLPSYDLPPPHPPLSFISIASLRPRNGYLSLGRQAGRLPPVSLHADRVNRKLLFLGVPRSNPSGPSSARFPSAPA